MRRRFGTLGNGWAVVSQRPVLMKGFSSHRADCEAIALTQIFLLTSPFAPSSIHAVLSPERQVCGWLRPDDAFFRLLLGRAEPALLPQFWAAKVALHTALISGPSRSVTIPDLQTLQDTDTCESCTHFLRFCGGLPAAGMLEAWDLSVNNTNWQHSLAQGMAAVK